MKILEEFILSVPYLFLKKIPYAWVGVVFFWNWPPVVSGVLLAIMATGLFMMIWKNLAWQTRIIREFSGGKTPLILDHPHAPRAFQFRNLLLVLVGSAGVGWLLNGRLGINGWQWFFFMAGFMLLYKDGLLFGAGVTYILTDKGIGIRIVPGHVDYNLFFKYDEIRQAMRVKVPEPAPLRWELLTPQKHLKEGVLLFANRPEGFSKQLQGEILLAPTDIAAFLAYFSMYLPVVQHTPIMK